MDIGTVDYWANNGRSSMHRASPTAKLLAAGLIVAAVIASEDPFLLLTIYLAVAAVIVSTKLPTAPPTPRIQPPARASPTASPTIRVNS